MSIVSFGNSEEKKIPVTKLSRIKSIKEIQKNLIFDDEDLEKPYFPDRSISSSAVTFELSINGDCIPYTVNRYLRAYQREGAQFLYGHYAQKRGCVLGDDMGLGKTIQVISFLAAVLQKKGTRADIENNMPDFLVKTMKKEMPSVPKKIFLIVAPLSVLYNWKDELDTWGYFKIIVLHGNRKEYELNRIKQRKFEIVLTTYETLRLCLDELNYLKWSAVIVDEVHRIKNPKAQITQTMKALTCNVRIGLTGTIMQNNMKELWCVMDWAIPGILGSEAQFKKEFSDPVEHGQRHTATKRELAVGRKAMQRLAHKTSRYFLRRTKALINNQLPKKEDRMVYCSLTEFQSAVYKAVLETEDVLLVLRAQEPCSCNSGHKRKNCCYKTNAYGETIQALYFSYLTILRKIANHAALLQTDNTTKQQETHINRVCSQVFSNFPDFVQLSKDAAFVTISDPKYSGKMKVLQKLLNHFRKSKDKVLLFSFSTKLLDVLEQYCIASVQDYRRLDGTTKAEDRPRIVKEFNRMEEVSICLVSTMAGGLGLNFIGANVVILFDPTWNPANDLQAIDRVYRIGQCRDVKVFRLISLGTVEEMMYLRQVYKQQLHCAVIGSENAKRYFEAVQGSKEHQGELFGIRNLFKFQDHGSCLTKEILEREGRVEAGVMTATTWLKEEPQPHKMEMGADQSCEEQNALNAKEPLEKEECDHRSDFCDEEPVRSSKLKAEQSRTLHTKNTTVPPGQLTLLQYGFSQLLERRTKTADNENSSSSSDDDSDYGKLLGEGSKGSFKGGCSLKTKEHCSISGHQRPSVSPKITKQKLCAEVVNYDHPISSDSEEEKDIGSKIQDVPISNQVGVVMETEESSQDSEDIIFPSQVPSDQETVKNCKSIMLNVKHLDADKSPGATPLQKRLTSEQRCREMSSSCKIKPFGNLPKTTSSVKEASDVSDESDDIEMPVQPKSGRLKATSTAKQKHIHTKEYDRFSSTVMCGNKPSMGGNHASSQNTVEFSSPEDGLPVRKVDAKNQRCLLKSEKCRSHIESRMPRNSRYPSITMRKRSHSKMYQTPYGHQTLASQGGKVGSLDRLLDDVSEVSFIHSNQTVVGSSKAENQMSRWAVRDVFELQQFSQLPANVAVCSAKKDKENPEKALSRRKTTKINHSVSEIRKPSLLCITHPVCQKQKRVYRGSSVTFLIGKTPQRIRRKQFEEMARCFHKASVEELAKYIAKATSEERQKMLEEFYGAKYPEFKNILKIDTSDEGVLHAAQFRTQKSSSAHGKTKPSLSTASVLCKAADLCNPKRHKTEAKQFQYDPCIQGAMDCNVEYKQTPTVITQDSISGRNSQAFNNFIASDSLNSKLGKIEGPSANATKRQQTLKGAESPRNPFLFQSESRQMQTGKKDSLADLLGDTSILNELFNSSGTRPTEPARKSPSKMVERAKTRPKDFWDMLNEENEESLEKLTDMAVIEELCERAPLATLSKKKQEDKKSLWQKNDDFLWKKSDTGDETSST